MEQKMNFVVTHHVDDCLLFGSYSEAISTNMLNEPLDVALRYIGVDIHDTDTHVFPADTLEHAQEVASYWNEQAKAKGKLVDRKTLESVKSFNKVIVLTGDEYDSIE